MTMPEFQVIDGGRAQERQPSQEPDVLKLSVDLDAEAAVISSVVNDETLIDEARTILRDEQFYSEAHRRMFEACCALRDAGKPIDVVTMSTQLRDTDRLTQAGGMAYITTVLNSAPALSSARLKTYAESVRNKYVRRTLKSVSDLASARAATEPTPIEVVIDEARSSLDKLLLEMNLSEKDAAVSDVLKRTLKRLQAMKNTDGKGEMPTGFDRLDRILGGLNPILMVLAARPGMGKTSLSTNIAVNVAGRPSDDGELRNGVYYASQETMDEEAMIRLWCAEARVDVARARTGMLSQGDWGRLTQCVRKIDSLPMWIDDESAQTVASLWGRCRRVNMLLKRKGKRLRLVVIDYLQLMKAPRKGMEREAAVGENARSLVAMAKDLDACVMALSQLNRKCEERTDKRPMLSDLRESGEIEQSARAIVFIYRDEVYNKKSEEQNIAELIVAKQNNGPIDFCKVRFDKMYTRFDNLAEGYEDEYSGPPAKSAAVPVPPPGRFDDEPEITASPPATQAELLPKPEGVRPSLEQRIVKYVYEAVTPGITLAELRDGLGKTKRMSVGTVEKGVRAAIQQGLIVKEGETLRRLK